LNRTELLSPIPRSDPDFRTLAPLRNDAESNNGALEDKLFNKRAHSVGYSSQRANLLGYALLVNSLTLYLAKRRAASVMTPRLRKRRRVGASLHLPRRAAQPRSLPRRVRATNPRVP